jgi:hypothetical protein
MNKRLTRLKKLTSLFQMKKFKIQEPSDLETPRDKKKFFNWVDKNYVAKEEPSKDKGVKPVVKK